MTVFSQPTDLLCSEGVHIRDGINIIFEAFVLGLTLFKTLGIKRQAAAAGVHTSLTNLLVHDGKHL